MSVASPVLERKVSASEDGAPQTTTYRSVAMSSEELHNARIKDNYARLINPNYKIEDFFTPPEYIEKQINPTAVEEVQPVVETKPEQNTQPYLVENARADAAIFRADSEVNRKQMSIADIIPDAAKIMEEENEDLRPTNTTIQYKTRIEKDENVEFKPTTHKKESVLGKKEKIIIATFIAVVIALFALVIINSAIIANLNNDITNLQDGLTSARVSLTSINNEIAQVVSAEKISEFAAAHNMSLK